jgi:hypothetical protein
MSEYQYYEFLAIDKPLTNEQRTELRAISSRAEITSTRFTNEYNYGDFRGDPVELIERYYDAHLYIANWGSRVLMFGIPSKAIDVKALQPYQAEGGFAVQERRGRVLVTFEKQDQDGGGGWVEDDEGESWMSALVGLRADLMNGDLRAAYLGWLRGLQSEGLTADDFGDEETDDEDDERYGLYLVKDDDDRSDDGSWREPPVPPGLGSLSGPLRELVSFLEIDQDLLAVAAAASEPLTVAEPSIPALKRWVGDLPVSEKDAIVLRLMQGDAQVSSELRRRFRDETAPPRKAATDNRRTVGELVTAMQTHAAERKRKEAEVAAAERRRKAMEWQRARDAHLDSLAGNEGPLWHQVGVLVGTRKPTDYDRAVVIVQDLRELAKREGTTADFGERLRTLRATYSNLPSFIRRLDQKRLV